ncbi:MAG: 3-ketoacyl-ACP reductase [Herpetosiphonaceae bacterium]|nr:MAG: 3-ketoacyl-ACP reductase [Herpetosiphonaceae bacterium]
MMDFSDQVAIVTGGSRGIGRATVEGLARRGCRVLFCYLERDAAAQETLAACAGLSGEVVALRADVREQAAVNTVVEETLSRWGQIDILVAAAGVTRNAPFAELSIDDWRLVLENDLTGIYRICKAVLKPMMRARYGRIVTVSGIQGLAGAIGQANYAAAAGGVLGFTRALARDVAAWGITANAVAPGLIATEQSEGFAPEFVEWSTRVITLRRMGTPAEVAHAILFLASREASYITGETLSVDGGWRMT